MSTQKFAIGTVIGAIVIFAVGYLFFDVLFSAYYTAHAGAAGAGLRQAQIQWAIVVGALGYGALVTYLIGKQANGSTIVGGLKAGALAGFLLWFTADFTMYGYLDLWNLTVTVLDVVLETVHGAIAGAVVAVVLAKMPR